MQQRPAAVQEMMSFLNPYVLKYAVEDRACLAPGGWPDTFTNGKYIDQFVASDASTYMSLPNGTICDMKVHLKASLANDLANKVIFLRIDKRALRNKATSGAVVYSCSTSVSSSIVSNNGLCSAGDTTFSFP